MDTGVLEQLGLIEITGAETFGGEAINPILVGWGIAAGAAVIGAVVNNWSSFTSSVVEAWSGATGG